ncbi:hypothetical protein GCM10029992_50940 [Glycomyces albus]
MSDSTDHTARDPLAMDYNGWLFWQHSTPEQRRAQMRRQEDILRRAKGAIGEATFISELAMVEPTEFSSERTPTSRPTPTSPAPSTWATTARSTRSPSSAAR